MKGNSKMIGAVLGPTMVAMVVAEFPLVQPNLYDAQIPPVVYLSGVLMFVAGLATVRAHSHWVRDWSVLVTVSGWSFLILGLLRMFSASSYVEHSAGTSVVIFIAIEVVLIAVGLIISFKSYSRR